MKANLIVSAALVFSPCLALAQTCSATDCTVLEGNSSLKVTIDPTGFNLETPSDPIQLPRKMEWTVDGRTILVYPSGPWSFIDVGHFHIDSHVGGEQIHAQGPMLGYATGSGNGTVTGGAVYTVDGGPTGSLRSRIVEKVDIHNKTGAALSLPLTGMGFKPTQNIPIPDYSGLDVTGTTTIYYQGKRVVVNNVTIYPYSITESLGGFPPVVVLPVVSFSGFNPLFNQSFSLPDGAVLTMVTELNVAPNAATICEIAPRLCNRVFNFFPR